MINIKDSIYEAYAVLADGQRLNLTPALTDLTWGDPVGELAAKATLSIAAGSKDAVAVVNMLALCTNIQIYANKKRVFSGQIWEREYTRRSEATVKLICYDRLIYASKSRDNGYWTAGRSTQSILSDIGKKWGIPIKYTWASITHPTVLYNSKTVSEQITATIEEAERQLGKTSSVRLEDEALAIGYEGKNTEILEFRAKEGILEHSRRTTLDQLVTRIIIVGQSKDGRPGGVEVTLNGKTEYGVLQEIVTRSGETTIAEAKKEAQELLQARGQPQDIISAVLPDVPHLRRGDKIAINAPDLSGAFIIAGVTHNASDRTMDVEIKLPYAG